MREWNLHAGDPLCLTIAADARLSNPDYANDHIWELSLSGGEPPALTLQTTFGLRASWLRLFPRFLLNGQAVSTPANFAKPPEVREFYPNYFSLVFAPFEGYEIQCEYWVPASNVVTGRLRFLHNETPDELLRLEWSTVLSTLGFGENMHPITTGSGQALAGRAEELCPVCVIAGPAQGCTSPFPALGLEMTQKPFIWALASLNSSEESLELARSTLAANWEAEIARIRMMSQSDGLDIFTGNPDWDAAFAFTQKAAFSLFFPASAHLPHSSFVLSRNPDQGYSPRGDGSDYPYSWSGQSGLNAWYLATLVPGAASLNEGLLRNFLHIQEENGAIDWKPGLGGQRGKYLAQPILATLACQIDKYKDDHAWLAVVYPRLLQFFRAWLGPAHDRDSDGFPEWDHPLQTGYEDNPLFDPWHPQSQGVNITTIESPALPAFLYREARSLMTLARRIDCLEDLPWLEEQAEILRRAVESTWDAASATYHFRDYQTHLSLSGRSLKSFYGSGDFVYSHGFANPQRLLIRVQAHQENTRAVKVTLYGQSPEGRVVEELSSQRFAWGGGEGRATTRQVYTTLERVEIMGPESKDRVRLSTIDYTQEAVSLLLPLWAGIPEAGRANALVEKTLLSRYLSPGGIPMCPDSDCPDGAPYMSAVQMPWNALMGEGLLAYGRTQDAIRLIENLMGPIISTLKQQGAFRQFYPSGPGQPTGERNSLIGLAPLGLFLRVIGIEAITPREILLRGISPYPEPITVKYRGVTITRQSAETQIIFASGQIVSLSGPGPYRVKLA